MQGPFLDSCVWSQFLESESFANIYCKDKANQKKLQIQYGQNARRLKFKTNNQAWSTSACQRPPLRPTRRGKPRTFTAPSALACSPTTKTTTRTPFSCAATTTHSAETASPAYCSRTIRHAPSAARKLGPRPPRPIASCSSLCSSSSWHAAHVGAPRCFRCRRSTSTCKNVRRSFVLARLHDFMQRIIITWR